VCRPLGDFAQCSKSFEVVRCAEVGELGHCYLRNGPEQVIPEVVCEVSCHEGLA
jgi:hypothetical protein